MTTRLTTRLGLAAALALSLPACAGLSEFAGDVAANMQAQNAANASSSSSSSSGGSAVSSKSREELMAAADAAVLQPNLELRSRVNCAARPSKVERSTREDYDLNDGGLTPETESAFLNRVDVTDEVLSDTGCHIDLSSDPHGGYGRHVYIVTYTDDESMEAVDNFSGTRQCVYSDDPTAGKVYDGSVRTRLETYWWLTPGPHDLGPAYDISTYDGLHTSDRVRGYKDLIADRDIAIDVFGIRTLDPEDATEDVLGRTVFCSIQSDANKKSLFTYEYAVTEFVPDAEESE